MGSYNMKRIGYVDSLKGLSMLMVVAGHIIIFCALNYDNSFVRHIVLVNMPLFFFLNGLVLKQIPAGGAGVRINAIKKKATALLIPFFVWGALITVFRGATYTEFLSNYFKFGYWYLPVLFQLCLINYLCDIVLNHVPKKNVLIETIALFALTWVFFRFCTRFVPVDINCMIDYYQVIEYMPYFFLGILVGRFLIGENIMRHTSVWTTSLLILSIVGYMWWNCSTGSVATFVLRVCLILLIYAMFIAYDMCSSPCIKGIMSMLAQIGRHTLAIYMIQFFLFRYIDLHIPGTYLYDSHNLIAFFILVTVASLTVCYVCILIEKVIATSRLFSFVLLGRRFASVSKNN